MSEAAVKIRWKVINGDTLTLGSRRISEDVLHSRKDAISISMQQSTNGTKSMRLKIVEPHEANTNSRHPAAHRRRDDQSYV